MEFKNIKDIIGKDIFICCGTEREANMFLQKCEDANIKWKDGVNPTSYNNWNINKDKTCYRIGYDGINLYNIESVFSNSDYLFVNCESFFENDFNLLKKLNQFTRRDFMENDVYIFSIILCDSQIDKNNECFSTAALEEMKEKFLGITGIIDDNKKYKAKIFYTEIVTNNKESDTEKDCVQLKAYVFMIRNKDNVDIISEIENGNKKDVSISCCAEKHICSICGTNRTVKPCSHIKGRYYNGKKCYVILDDITDVYEWAFVKKAEDKIDTDRTITSDVIISEIHKSNCELEILEYLQKWLIDTNNRLKIKCKEQDNAIAEIKKHIKVLADYDD